MKSLIIREENKVWGVGKKRCEGWEGAQWEEGEQWSLGSGVHGCWWDSQEGSPWENASPPSVLAAYRRCLRLTGLSSASLVLWGFVFLPNWRVIPGKITGGTGWRIQSYDLWPRGICALGLLNPCRFLDSKIRGNFILMVICCMVHACIFLKNIQIAHWCLKRTNGEFLPKQPWFTFCNAPRRNNSQLIDVKIFNMLYLSLL